MIYDILYIPKNARKYLNTDTEKIQFQIFYSKFANNDNILNDIKKFTTQDCIE